MFKNEGGGGVSFPVSKAIPFIPRIFQYLCMLAKLFHVDGGPLWGFTGLPECLPDNSSLPFRRLPLPGPVSPGKLRSGRRTQVRAGRKLHL